MTISATRTFEFTIDRIVRRAYQLAGLMNEQDDLTTVQGSTGRDFLESIADALHTQGLMDRAMTTETVTLVDATLSYTLATTTLDVVGEITSDSGITLGPLTREEWLIRRQTSPTGQPSGYYVDRAAGAALVLRFDTEPTAAEAGQVFTLQVHRLRADNQDGNATPDFERYWSQYFIWELAHQLSVASSLDIQRCGYLRSRAQEQLALCKPQAMRRGNEQARYSHRTQWSR